jgi:hypothetical protein
MLTLDMGRFDDQARRRIKAWMAANPEVTLTTLGQSAGHNQPWATRWLDSEYDTSLDALAGMAAIFGQPISALFDAKNEPREEELLMRFRGMPERRQQLMLDVARDYVPDEPVPRGRARSRKRNGG